MTLQTEQTVANADATNFQTNRGDDGFVVAEILKKRMKGRTFNWNRVGVRPEPGSHFEIRAKSGASILVPPTPRGVDDISAAVESGVRTGTIYRYSLWQVLADGRERELEDPELEVGEI
jgi:hypothetical protein